MLAVLKRKYHNLISDRKFSEILTGSAYAMAGRVAATVLTLVANVIVARFYGAEALGILALVNSFLILVTIFTVLGTNTSILRLLPEHIAKYSMTSAFYIYRKVQYMVAAVASVTALIFFFGSGVIADKVFSKPHLSFFFGLAAFFVGFKSIAALNTQAVRGIRLIKTYAVMQVLPSLTMLSLLLAGTVYSRDQGIPVYSQLAAWGFTALAGFWIMDRAFKRRMRPADPVRTMSVKDIAAISFPMLMTASMQFFVGQSGVVLLGMYRSESEVGYYSVAVKLATLTVFILQAINTMSASKFSELYHTGSLKELFYVARKSSKLIFWTTVPILLVLVLFGRPIIAMLFGSNFKVAYPAMVLLVMGQFINSISGSTGQFMNMTGHQKAFSNIIFVASVINVAVGFALIPKFGMNGAAFAGAISLGYWNIHTLLYIKFKYGSSIGYLPSFRKGPVSGIDNKKPDAVVTGPTADCVNKGGDAG